MGPAEKLQCGCERGYYKEETEVELELRMSLVYKSPPCDFDMSGSKSPPCDFALSDCIENLDMSVTQSDPFPIDDDLAMTNNGHNLV